VTIEVPENGKEDMAFGGLKIYHFCTSLTEGLMSVYETSKAFLGGLSRHKRLPWFGSHTPRY
jgi:hypothetical protein